MTVKFGCIVSTRSADGVGDRYARGHDRLMVEGKSSGFYNDKPLFDKRSKYFVMRETIASDFW